MNSVVKYNGVEIGKVKNVELDSNNPRNVIVSLNILSTVSINTDTYAILKAQGITGMSYIDLRLPKTSVSKTNLVVNNTPPYPQIASQPSLLYDLTEQAQSFTSNVQDISSQLRILLADDNLDHLSNTFNNLDKISTSIAKNTGKIDQGLSDLVAVLENIKQNSVKLNQTFENISDLTKSLAITSNNTNKLILGLQDNTMQNVNTVLLPNLNQTITNINQVTQELQQFLIILNQNPSVVVRGKAPGVKGPGE
jgi:phospholipid/cholesterol/gamma-HCH transport system substrate-binding protein